MKNTVAISMPCQLPIIYILHFTLIILASCSVQKKLGRSFEKDVLSVLALQTAHVGISLFDPSAGKYLFNYQGDKYFVPASNTKIPTCYAAMKYLGDSLVGLRYAEEDSTLYIKPTGDPTFLHREFKNQIIFDFLKKSKKNIFLLSPHEKNFPNPYGQGWQINDVSETYLVPRSEFPIYGNLVTFSIKNNRDVSSIPKIFAPNNVWADFPCNSILSIKKLDVFENKYYISCSSMDNGPKSISVPFRPTSGLIYLVILGDTLHKQVKTSGFTKSELQKIHSQPTDSLLKHMMHSSDNFFAEQALLMVSNEILDVMNDAKIIDTLLKTDLKDLPQKPRWVDGSGLSRYNLFTPQSFVAILNKMQVEFGMERIKEIFPTGGEGTLGSLYKTDSTFIYAKTGTLSGVVALSGFLYTQKGKLLIFSVLVNNHQGSATPVRKAVEGFIQRIRKDY